MNRREDDWCFPTVAVLPSSQSLIPDKSLDLNRTTRCGLQGTGRGMQSLLALVQSS